MFVLEKIENDGYIINLKDGRKAGDIIMDLDGHYKYFPDHYDGFWTEYMLMSIAKILAELNE